MKKWITLFSNSGKELAEVIEKVGRSPDVILCDKKRTEWDERLTNVQVVDATDIENMLKLEHDNTLITLHGYWRLIKASDIKSKIYNVHPGDIFKYPELKGLHPQKKAIELSLESTGVLIHSIDGGKPEVFSDYPIKSGTTVEELTEQLRYEAIKLWQIFLVGRI